MTTHRPCPRCGESGTGAYCSSCGARLDAAPCPSCGAESPPGDRFCTHCGASLSAAGRGIAASGTAGGTRSGGGPGSGEGSGSDGDPGGRMGWWVAGALLVALIVAISVPHLVRDSGGGSVDQGQAGADGADLGPTSSVDLSTLTPREAADRLFDRVVGSWEAGDRAEADRFRPMALAAYDRARPLDPDGHFHVAMLHITADDWEAALEAARAGLELDESHLLNLSVAAEAARELEDPATADSLHRRFLEQYDAEMASGRPEYEAHRALLPGMRRTALEATGQEDDGG